MINGEQRHVERAKNALFQEILFEKNLPFETGKRSGGSSVASDEHSHVGFIEVALGNGQHHLGKVVFRSIKVKSVQGEKNESRHRTNALVAINEGMVFHQVEQAGRGHLVDVRMQELPAIGGRRHAEGRLEQLHIPDAGSTPVAGHLVLVNLKHLGQAEESRIHRLLRKLLQGFGVPGIGLVKGDLEGRVSASVFNRSENEHLPVGGNIKLCVGVSAKQLQNRLFDHQGQAVTVFGQSLDHGLSPPCSLIHCLYKDITGKQPSQEPLAFFV